MRTSFDAEALSGDYLVGCHGGRVISRVDFAGDLPVGFHTRCPYSKPFVSRYVGLPIPPIRSTSSQHTGNTYGQFGVLRRTGDLENSPAAFFHKDPADLFDSTYAGVRFNSDSRVYVHVSVFENRRWNPSVSEALAPPLPAIFHRNPYCVLDGNKLYMMYLVGFIVSFDIDLKAFRVINLPTALSRPVKTWFDYTVGPHPGGGLALVHFSGSNLVRWVLRPNDHAAHWRIETSVHLWSALGHRINNSVQVRSASPDARFVFVTVGLNQGIIMVDMLQRRAEELTNIVFNGVLGRVFPLEEDWPPKP
jgi:hypothetical protein